MEPELEVLPLNYVVPHGFYSKGFKRIKMSGDRKDFGGTAFSESIPNGTEQSKPKNTSKTMDYSDPLSIPNLLDGLDCGKFGSVTKEIEYLLAQRRKILHPYFLTYPTLPNLLLDLKKKHNPEVSKLRNQQSNYSSHCDIISVDDDNVASEAPAAAQPVVIIDSDEEEDEHQKPSSYPFQEIVLMRQSGQLPADMVVRDHAEINAPRGEEKLGGETHIRKDKGVYVGVEEDESNTSDAEDDGLDDIWKEMKMSLEFSQDSAADLSAHEHGKENAEDCDHSYVLKDDLGYVCRVCGVIDRGIETIFEFQYNKGKRSTRTYVSDYRNAKDRDSNDNVGVNLSVDDLIVTEVSAHPRHMKQMKPHQVEGFNFLVSNLVADNPGGCILAHAPGSGKTFMIISFMQSFLAKYPHARPLVVLPKGILATWKKEFQIWQVEDIPLLDFYTVKADNRSQQLEVLKQWVEQRSILFLGYKQLSTIICESGSNKISASCQEILLKAPSILILDEGHTPRNENTNVLQSLAKVQTPRKVVLSGTLYQNHVKEVFNILNLVRPKFLRMDASRSVVKRILSRVHISGLRKQFKGGVDTAFFDLVEHTLQKDEDFRRKVTIIQDLREMTSKVLHYYKGDFLDELPGLDDFTVLLNLSPRQTREVQKLRKLPRKFKISAVGSSVYVHPELSSVSENCAAADHKVDELLENLNVNDGVKAKFFLNMINLCDSAGERLLVFSPYLLPLKFLERLTVKTKGWSLGKEIFVISGESSAEQREWSMDRFNNSPDAKVFFGSIKACGEGISLVGASRVIILDVHLNPSVTRQAIGRAFRPGQKKKVFTYRLVAADSPEEEDHSTCFKKELIAKMWFEWNEYCGYRDFEVETVDMQNCGDLFLESPLLREDIKQLYKR